MTTHCNPNTHQRLTLIKEWCCVCALNGKDLQRYSETVHTHHHLHSPHSSPPPLITPPHSSPPPLLHTHHHIHSSTLIIIPPHRSLSWMNTAAIVTIEYICCMIIFSIPNSAAVSLSSEKPVFVHVSQHTTMPDLACNQTAVNAIWYSYW